MKEFDETMASIIRKGDIIIEKRRYHIAMIKRIAFSVSGICAAVIIGTGIWHNSALKNAVNDRQTETIIENDSANTMTKPFEESTQITTKNNITATVSTTVNASESLKNGDVNTAQVSTSSVKNDIRSTSAVPTYTTIAARNETTNTVPSVSTAVRTTEASITTASLTTENPIENIPYPEMEPYQIFVQFENENGRYLSAGSSPSPEMIGDKTGEKVFSRNVTNEDGQTTTVNLSGTIYQITNISEQAALAVKFDNYEKYWVYLNTDYSPQTLEQFISDLDLNKGIFTGSATFTDFTSRTKLSGLDKSYLWETLMSDTSLENSYISGAANKYQMLDSKIKLDIHIPELNLNATIGVTEYGYFNVNFNSFLSAYYIGEDRSAKMYSYLSEKKKSITNIPLVEADNPVPE